MSIPLRVLVIESSEADALLYLGEIHSGGYEVLYERVTTIEDVSSALDVGPWEAILASTTAPGVAWTDVLDELRARDLDTPFLLIAPDPFDRDAAVRAMQAGAHDYIRMSDLSRVLPALERALKEASIRRDWREAELVVRESEERFRLLVEGVRDYALFMLDTEGRVASWNAGAQRLHGYFAAEIIGQHYTLFNPTESAASSTIEDDLETAFRKGRTEKEGWRLRKDGSQFWAHVIITALHDDRGRLRGFSKLTRDITERKRVEMALAERAEELSRSEDALKKHTRILRSVLDSMGEGVVVCDEEGSLLLFNPAAELMLGATLFTSGAFEPAQDYGLYLPDTTTPFPEDDLPIHRAILGESIDGAEIFVRDGRSRAGKYVNVTARPLRDEGGHVRGGVAVFRDTTGQKNAQAALFRAQSELREVIEKIPDGVGICREGRFVYVNPAFAACLGYSPEELAGKPLLDLVEEGDREKAATRMQGTTEPESARAPGELRYLRFGGGIVTLEVAPVQALEFEGAPAYLFVARDVTEQKKMQARLLLADRMASVGTLAAGVAHEINNPLAYVIANVELVAGELMALGLEVPALLSLLPETSERALAEERLVYRLREMEQTLHEAQEGTERVRQITRDLKTFSRADEERRAAVDVTRVLDASINMAWNEIRHRARLIKSYGRVPSVEANEARIGQVFLNLLINAAQAIPEGAADRNEIRVTTQIDGPDRVRIDVSDTGSGIPAESMPRIFDPFFTTKPVGVGTGLGLSICHGIVTQLGGEILVKSEVGKGSMFSVVLRVSRSPAAAAKAAPEPARTGRRGRVLVVDDEAMIGTAIRRTLSSEHDVFPLTSAREALDRIAGGERFDVVLCDLMMPVMSGMELYEELCRFAPDQAKRVVFLTGGAFTQRGQEFLDNVPNPRIDKPFDNRDLRSIVRERVRWQEE